ncbi:MAG TPA: B12-binding domain-containing protein [Nitrososphaera sp.]|jgi:MerR family transcriptional regulator, light-induced transcriptional regulator|nr:B12-binding domain-containing protein [Nitrososphaera sp.]
MVYIRSKVVKGIPYAYLVKSEWDDKRRSSIQHTIKYLGRADSVVISDIPEEYRNDPKILSFLSSHSSKNQAKKQALLEELRAELFEALCNADREKAVKIAAKYQSLFNLVDFYDDLTSVLYRVGDLWAQNSLSVATEHVCSNTAIGLVEAINESNSGKGKMSSYTTIVICSPEGELHQIASKVIESLLLQKGFNVHNMSPSAPSGSISSYIESTKPALVMVSVTLSENLKAGIRLLNTIRTKSNVPVLMGGAAIKALGEENRKKLERSHGKLTLVTETSLQRIMQLVKKLAI